MADQFYVTPNGVLVRDPDGNTPDSAVAEHAVKINLTEAERTAIKARDVADPVRVALEGLEAKEASGSPVSGGPFGPKIKVLIVGSSNAAGNSASSYANSWAGRLATQYAATHEFINVSIPGRSAQYWTQQNIDQKTPTAGEPVAIEYWILQHRPDIVIGAFTMQNGWDGTPETFLNCIRIAAFIAEKNGAKYVGVTPYISNSYDASMRAINRFAADAVTRMGFPVIDFQSVWEVPDGQNIPSVIDAGDGLHVNDVGHYEQWAAVPQIALSPVRVPIPDKIVSTLLLTIPNDVSTPNIIGGVKPGPGSWTFGFFQKLPTSTPSPPLLALNLFNAGNLRMRAPTGTRYEIADTTTRITALRDNVFDGRTQHWMLSYNKSRNRVRLYQDGDLCGEYVWDLGLSLDVPVTVGGRADTGAYNNVGFGYYGFTLMQSEINPREAYKFAKGIYPNRSLSLCVPMDDCALAGSKQAGERIVNAYGAGQALVCAVAI